MLLQMLLRGSNAVGYAAYPDNLIESFVEKAAETGIDIFRIFDSLNWVKAIEPSITYVRKRTQSVAEAAVCYTGNILDPKRTKYNLAYYVQMAKDLENAGAHMIAIKDMAGLLKPEAAKLLVEALRDAVKLPIHLHTHDASGLQLTTYLKAIEAGVDVVDVALGSMSSLTSQPSFNSLVEMLEFHERENPYDKHALEQFSRYWETVREWYYPFESGMKAPSASVYYHEMPGGQYSNLKRQALELGIADQWDRVVETYAEVNEMFGDIVKVTPSSKVVGDMALLMVSKGLTKKEVLETGHEISFPESVKSFFRGDLGQPYGGFPTELQKMVLKDEKPYTDRPNKHMKPIDLTKGFKAFQQEFGKQYAFTDFLSWQLYPKVFENYHKMVSEYGDIYKIPTRAFLFGMKPNEETTVEIAVGKTILVELMSIGEPDKEGMRRVFFKLNGQNRTIKVQDRQLNIKKEENPKADPNQPGQIGSPLQGLLSKVFVKAGQVVEKNAPLFIIEAMKMENTVVATQAGKVDSTHLKEGTLVNPGDWVVSLTYAE
jgi:pyruvate carboxylase